MKKTLIAAATAILATTAYAQSSVEVYGLIDLSIDSSKTTQGTTVTKTSATAGEGAEIPSRLGFRGTEDIGGGIKASFVIETGLGTGLVGDRLTALSLSSNLGTVTVGTFWNAFDDVLTGDGKGGSVVPLVGIMANETLTSNGIAYKSPQFSGFTFGFGMSQNKASTDGVDTTNNRSQEVSLAYANGPLNAIAAFGSGKNLERPITLQDGTEEVSRDNKINAAAFKVSYDLGFAVPYVIYASETARTGPITNTDVLNSREKSNGYELGASFPMGALTPYVTVARAKSDAFLDGTFLDQNKTSGQQVGVNYDMSKRTKLYAVVGSNKIKDRGVTTDKFSQTSVGVMHTF